MTVMDYAEVFAETPHNQPAKCVCGGTQGWYESEGDTLYCNCPAGQALRLGEGGIKPEQSK